MAHISLDRIRIKRKEPARTPGKRKNSVEKTLCQRNQAATFEGYNRALDKQRDQGDLRGGQKKTASEDAVFKLECDAALVGSNRGHHWVNIHAPSFAVKAYVTVHQGENRVIPAEADILARSELRATLPDDNVTGNDGLATKLLYTETLAVAVAAVLD